MREAVPLGRDPIHDPEQFVDLEIVDGWLTVRATLMRELRIEIVEERGRDADRPTVRGHRVEDSSASIRSWTRARTRARISGGTSSRSLTILASNRASTSAGVISSSSAAFQSLRGIRVRLSLGSLSNKGLV